MEADSVGCLVMTTNFDGGITSLRVLSVIPGEGSGVSMIFAKRQVESLRALGVENHEFFLSSRTHPLQLFKEIKRLKADIVSTQPDIVHAHYGTVTALLCALVASVPIVITYRGSDLNPSSRVGTLRSLFGKVFSQLAALRARKIICVSSKLKDCLWWRQDLVDVIPSGVDTGLFYPQDRLKCRVELGWGESERVVVFNAGKSPKVKRLDLAQAVVATAQRLCGPIKFVVLDGTMKPSSVPVLLNAADCLILTSDYEGSPNVVKESLACNLPVVSVNVGDVEERLRGIYPSAVAERNVEVLAQLVSDILMSHVRSNGTVSINEISQTNVARKMVAVYLACMT